MKIKATDKLKGLDGKDIDLTVGQAIANMLVAGEEGGKMKLYILAQDLWQKENVELDKADIALVKSIVENTKVYNVLVSGQILVILNTDSDKGDSKKE